jgi:hypothetical protein
MASLIKHSNSHKQFSRNKILFFVFLLFSFGLSTANGQEARVNIITTSQCALQPNVYTMISGVTLEIDGKIYELAGSGLETQLLPGTHKVRASLSYNQDAKLVFVHAQGIKRQIYHADAAGVATVELDARGDNWEVRLESCISEQKDVSRVTILATQSCTTDPAERVSVVGGASVWIGNKRTMTGEDGRARIEIERGTYATGASWKDAIFAYANHNGMQIKGTEAGFPQIKVSAKNESLELRLVTCGTSGGRKERAKVSEIDDSMSVTRKSRVSNETTTQNAFPGMILRDGDEVEITGGGQLQWLAGGTINFNSRRYTVIVIGPDAPQGTQSDSVRIIKGFVNFIIQPGEPVKKYKFEAATGTVKTSVKGTIFSIDYDDVRQITKISVTEGEIKITPVNQAIPAFILTAGRSAEVSLTTAKFVPFISEETKTSTSAIPKNIPIRVCELFPEISRTVCGIWTWDGGSQIIYRLDEGNTVVLQIERLAGSEIVLTVVDTTNQYGVYRARYTGRISGNRIDGEVFMTMGDIKGTNRWTAQWGDVQTPQTKTNETGNLALKKTATQSSVYPPIPLKPEGAIDGEKTGGFGFHTDLEPNPWWQVDLGAVKNLTEIRIFNRLDCCSERARTIQVLLSNDGVNWTRVFANDGSVFGGRDGKFLRVSLKGQSARFVRLQLNETNYLHLDEVEIY